MHSVYSKGQSGVFEPANNNTNRMIVPEQDSEQH